MCGICGIVNLRHSQPVNRQTLLDMTASMTHRGPDEEGAYYCHQAGLGSRRLSIIDLVSGRQPIANEDETLWIVFNGEIYNYRELRAYLQKRGHQFRTQTDTETILHLYEEFGAECFEKLNGIFAIAIWDIPNQQAILARDRMGVKPLYYSVSGGQLVFGSEMKVLLANPLVKREIDYIALNEYLSFEYVPTPRTILRNIYRLEPGHYLRYDQSGLHTQPYWKLNLERSENRPPVDWRDFAEGLYQTLKESVRSELVSDVPVGVLLSGGIDSSAVTAFMVDLYPGAVDSFSISFEEESFDESRYARLASRHLGTRHHELTLTSKTAASMVADITDYLDEPFGDSSLIPTYLLSKFARQYVKVALGGDGGDELFAGYPTLKAHRMIEFYERLAPWTIRAKLAPKVSSLLPVSFSNISLDFKIRRFLAGRGVSLQERHHRWLGSFFDEEKALLLQDWIKPVLGDTYARAYQHEEQSRTRYLLNAILYSDIKLYLEGDILFKVDRASMANSLEVRVPLLNPLMVEFASALPFDLKLHNFTSKYLLKKCMARRLPREIINRPKKGFNMPVASWLTTELRPLMLDMFSEEMINRQGLFNYPYIKRLIDDHLARRRDNRKLLWTLLVFQLWYNRYST